MYSIKFALDLKIVTEESRLEDGLTTTELARENRNIIHL